MTTASITTDINIGPYKIPSNAQNMIMNNFASRNGLKVELVIPEPIMSDQLKTTQWLNKEFSFQNIILCSLHQLPKNKAHLSKLIKNLKNVTFHFAIEGVVGKGKKFLIKSSEEANFFEKADLIDSQKFNWLELYEMINK